MRKLILAIAMVLPFIGMAVPANAIQIRTLYYDTSQAQEFAGDWDTAAANWNKSVTDVRMVKRGANTPVNVRIFADNGWPRTYPGSLGSGTVYMGREAVNEGFYRPRIATHEFGHILGLPDNRTGRCSDLMSGHSAPISCKSDLPSPAEAAQVQRNFQNGLVPSTVNVTVYVD
ncbi:snapalysin family zinc-dependent metalloprotease [Actinocrispum wychmicini]|uniref:Extracellular small neutral protease n=1 Tax=Actinocrispum wychmicini TaxID=1213861 RepID=A0A4R2JE64_9PSEU|nr:snapalysin family zinc-dependent metalloprotease [Actinocrispum wychmicini]TCO57274.1 snapalysin [Actinocrispum wychmicini]